MTRVASQRHPGGTPSVELWAWPQPAPRPPLGEQRPPPLPGSAQALQQQQQGSPDASVADCGLLQFRTLAPEQALALLGRL